MLVCAGCAGDHQGLVFSSGSPSYVLSRACMNSAEARDDEEGRPYVLVEIRSDCVDELIAGLALQKGNRLSVSFNGEVLSQDVPVIDTQALYSKRLRLTTRTRTQASTVQHYYSAE
ncbi:hypothetical protein D9M68_895190 [compost metagenome]